MKPALLRRMMNVWPPFAASGIHVERFAGDWSYARVALKLRPWNRNAMGSQFGGNLYAMCDPFWALMAIHRLGKKDYLVWDAAGAIEFLAPARQTVYAEFRVDDGVRNELIGATAKGRKHLPWFENDIVTGDGTVVARVKKQLMFAADRAARRAGEYPQARHLKRARVQPLFDLHPRSFGRLHGLQELLR